MFGSFYMFEKFVPHPFVYMCTFDQSREISYQYLGKQKFQTEDFQ